MLYRPLDIPAHEVGRFVLVYPHVVKVSADSYRCFASAALVRVAAVALMEPYQVCYRGYHPYPTDKNPDLSRGRAGCASLEE